MRRPPILAVLCFLCQLAAPAAGQDDPAVWVERLGDADWEIREEATRWLIHAGEPARPAVEAALPTDDPELGHRLRHVLANLGNLLAAGDREVVVNGAAEVIGEEARVLRLTGGLNQKGSAFLAAPGPRRRFAVLFRFRMTEAGGYADPVDGITGADGMTYALVADPAALGAAGGDLGRSGIAPCLSVELDTWPNEGDLDGNHLAIHAAGTDEPLAAVALERPLNDGAEGWIWIDHDPVAGRLEVRLARVPDRPDEPTLAADVDLEALFGEDPVHHGFTAGTGAATNAHLVEAWSLSGDR